MLDDITGVNNDSCTQSTTMLITKHTKLFAKRVGTTISVSKLNVTNLFQVTMVFLPSQLAKLVVSWNSLSYATISVGHTKVKSLGIKHNNFPLAGETIFVNGKESIFNLTRLDASNTELV